METAYKKNRNSDVILTLVAIVALVTATGCARGYHAFHYNGIARTLHEGPSNYFHSGRTGRIIPKEKCYCPVELPCYGYEPTCWRRWSEDCVRCPVVDEVIDGEILIREDDTIESNAEAVFPPDAAPDAPDVVSPDLSVGDTRESNGSARAGKPAPAPIPFDLQAMGDHYRFASNPKEQLARFEAAEDKTLASFQYEAAEQTESIPKLDSIVPATNGVDQSDGDSLIDDGQPNEEEDATLSAASTSDEGERFNEADEWKPGTVDETIDVLIGDELSVHEQDLANDAELILDEDPAESDAANHTNAISEYVDSLSESGFVAATIEPNSATGQIVAEDELKSKSTSETNDSVKRSAKDVSSPNKEFTNFTPSALPNFALPLPVKLPTQEIAGSDPSARKSASVTTKRESVTKKPVRKNTVRFKAESKSTEIIVPTDGSKDSESTIQFK